MEKKHNKISENTYGRFPLDQFPGMNSFKVVRKHDQNFASASGQDEIKQLV